MLTAHLPSGSRNRRLRFRAPSRAVPGACVPCPYISIFETSKLRKPCAMPITAFTPIASLVGGALIGVSAVMLMALNGRIAGVSGIAARLFPPYADNEFTGRLAFVGGLIAAPLPVLVATGKLPAQTIHASGAILRLPRFLGRFGSAWGKGCRPPPGR